MPNTNNDPSTYLNATEKAQLAEQGGGLDANDLLFAKMHILVDIIVERHGAELHQTARQAVAKHGRLPWQCILTVSQWVSLEPAGAAQEIKIVLSRGCSGNSQTSVLESLLAMDPEKEFVLEMMVLRDSDRRMVLNGAVVINPTTDLPPEIDVAYTISTRLHNTVENRTPKHKCIECGSIKKPSSLPKCSGCNYARYCSPTCQRADWARHKEQCRLLKQLLPGSV